MSSGASGVQDEGLWVSDGTSSGTRLVKDVNPVNSTANSESQTMAVVSNRLVFRNDSSGSRVEIWISDGTTAGTQLLKDINSGSNNSSPEEFAVVGGSLYFTADNGTHGREIWISDGTVAGTQLLKDITLGSADADIEINMNDGFQTNPGFMGALYFVAETANEGRELWVSNGTTQGTHLLRDIHLGSSGSFGSGGFESAAEFNNRFYFSAESDEHGIELWQIDANGIASLAYDLDEGDSHSFPEHLVSNNDFLFFSAKFDFNRGVEPTILDKEGRIRQIDIYSGGSSSAPEYLHIREDGSVIFTTGNSFAGPGVGLYQITCPTPNQ